jgi:hypothetical protein
LLNVRLKNQKLVASTLRAPADIVQWLGAVQAQDYVGAKWALALRGRGITDRIVEDAFASGAILRTHVLRPTWHFVTPADIGWMISLNCNRLRRINKTYAERLELDDKLLTRARTILERALTGGRALTRSEISETLRRAGIEASGQRLAHLLFDLEQQAAICSGPRRGKQFTYALFSDRVPATALVCRDEALARLAQRYFQSHGPATLRDFCWWSGLTMRDAREAVALAAVDPLPAPPPLQRVAGAHFLLPNFDEYLVAYRDRSAVIDPARSRNLGVFTSAEHPHQLIIDGRVAGSWKRTISDTLLSVDAWPYRRLTSPQRAAVARSVERQGAFLGIPARLRMTSSKLDF